MKNASNKKRFIVITNYLKFYNPDSLGIHYEYHKTNRTNYDYRISYLFLKLYWDKKKEIETKMFSRSTILAIWDRKQRKFIGVKDFEKIELKQVEDTYFKIFEHKS